MLIPLSPYPLRNSKCKPIGLGYAFFETSEDAEKAILELTSSKFKSRTLLLHHHIPYVPAKEGAIRGFYRFKESKTTRCEERGSPLLTLSDESNPVEGNPLNEIKRHGGYERGGIKSQIMNGLKPKAEAAKAVTSRTMGTGETRANGKVSETVDATETTNEEVKVEDADEVVLNLSSAAEDDYLPNMIFIRNLRGKVDVAAIREQFKKFNPIDVKIMRMKRYPRGFVTRSNALVSFNFEEGDSIDLVLEDCKKLLFNGHPLEAYRALKSKISFSPGTPPEPSRSNEEPSQLRCNDENEEPSSNVHQSDAPEETSNDINEEQDAKAPETCEATAICEAGACAECPDTEVTAKA